MSADDDLAAMVRAEVARQLQAQTTQIMTVQSVRDDGLVNLTWGEAIIDGVAANVSYNPRTAGDTVMVMQSAAGWRVIDKVGAPTDTAIPDPIELTFGPNQPAGYAQGITTWVKDGALHIQTGSGPAPGPGDPPTASTPKPATIDPDWRQGYRNGRRDSQRIAQGASPEYPHPWTAAWGYRSLVSDACAGKTVAKMEIKLTRTSKGHGTKKGVRPNLGSVESTSPPSSTPKLSHRWDGNKLGWGESDWMTIPSSLASLLASGDVRTLGASAGVSNYDYIIFTSGSGQIRVTFSA